MQRKLASIQSIRNLESIPNADNIEVATVLGWKVVSKKGDFKIGDKCIIRIGICFSEGFSSFSF